MTKDDIMKVIDGVVYYHYDYTDYLYNIINKALEKLKEHKQDLDYEPWSVYQIEGKILFDLVDILKGESNGSE